MVRTYYMPLLDAARCDTLLNANSITRFYIGSGKEFKTWCKQNAAQYSGAYVEGCLLDNFVMMTKRGFAAFYEHYLNEWCSDYYVEFQPGPAQDVWANWYKFEKEMESV